jgi:RNA ligase (TIGR02306 family)
LSVGDSVVEHFGLTKWIEEEEEASDPSAKGNKKKAFAQNEKKPDGWAIPYYDIESIRKFVVSLEEGEEIVLTEKIHGANAGFSHDGDKLWCKSRNYYKRGEFDVPIRNPETGEITGTQVVQSTDQWWEVARLYKLEEKLAQHPGLVFFGEVAGQVKGFRYDAEIVDGRLQPRVYFFDIWDTKQMKYLDYDDRVTIIRELGFTPVPELYRGPWLGKEKMYPYAEGKTTLGGRHVREGFVAVTAKERFCERLNSRMQLKLVGEGYNLQK